MEIHIAQKCSNVTWRLLLSNQDTLMSARCVYHERQVHERCAECPPKAAASNPHL